MPSKPPYKWVIDKSALRYAMRRAGYPPGDAGAARLALEIGCSDSTVSRLVHKDLACPSVQVLMELARLLGCAPEDLLRRAYSHGGDRRSDEARAAGVRGGFRWVEPSEAAAER